MTVFPELQVLPTFSTGNVYKLSKDYKRSMVKVKIYNTVVAVAFITGSWLYDTSNSLLGGDAGQAKG